VHTRRPTRERVGAAERRQDEPLLLVMSDHIFDQRLLRRCCCVELPRGFATVLVDDTPGMIDWAKPGGVHCQAHCKHGHCGSLVKVLKGEDGRISRIGKRLGGFDALEAGAFVVRCVARRRTRPSPRARQLGGGLRHQPPVWWQLHPLSPLLWPSSD
jgi:choline kinase